MKKHMAFQSLTYVLVMFSCFRSSWSFFFMSSISWQDQWRTMVRHFDQHPRGPKGVPRGFEGGPKGVPQLRVPQKRFPVAGADSTNTKGSLSWSERSLKLSRLTSVQAWSSQSTSFGPFGLSWHRHGANSWIATPVDTCCCGVCRKKQKSQYDQKSPITLVRIVL